MAPAKEPRRSNRRSAHSSTTSKSSGSPSPDTAGLPPPDAQPAGRSAASSSAHPAPPRSKRSKDEAGDAPVPPSSGHRRTTSIASTLNGPNQASGSKRSKRKKEPASAIEEVAEQPAPVDVPDAEVVAADEEMVEEETGVTRCVCDGAFDDDGDAPEFMVQCEICMVWQHGPCVGFAQESELPPGDYYCEQCKPENHVELLKKLQRRQRQSSDKSGRTSHAARESRSHSPTQFLKTTKRRNTMNSRDAAYEQSIQELLEATAAEGGTAINGDVQSKDGSESVTKTEEVFEEIVDIGPSARKKRKRTEEDAMALMKRKRSTSIVSERIVTTSLTVEKPELASPVSTTLLPPPLPPPTNNKSRVRRSGGRKNAAAQDPPVAGDGEDATPATRKHPNQYTYRAKSGAGGQNRRAPSSATGQNQGSAATHEHGTRRNANAKDSGASGAGRNHNAYYNNLQLPMFTTWSLPDYLAHLQSILPSDIPPPLQIRGATSFFREDLRAVTSASMENGNSAMSSSTEDGGDQPAQAADDLSGATESLTERGAKVKWPAKRMSVSDMNKRVRALVEWVGREQALALDRERRKVALQEALAKEQPVVEVTAEVRTTTVETSMAVDKYVDGGETPTQEKPVPTAASDEAPLEAGEKVAVDSTIVVESTVTKSMEVTQDGVPAPVMLPPETQVSTTKMMEELMEELISFQERFGPGAKGMSRDRHARVAVMS